MLKMLLLVLFSVSVSIKGPESVVIREVLTLTAETEDCVNVKWLVPDSVKMIADGDRLHLVAPKAGTYRVTLIGVDKEYEIDAAVHTFTVTEKE